MPLIQEAQTRNLLQKSPDAKLVQLSKDAELVTALTAVFNASLDIAEEMPATKGQLVGVLAKKGHAISGLAEKASGSKALEVGNFMVGQSLKSIGLLKVAGMTPGRASAYITLTLADKVVSAAGLAQLDKCHMAIATLAVSSGAGAFACVGTAGIGCVAGAIAVAADAFNVYGQCRGRW
jgi:hypothetical protein